METPSAEGRLTAAELAKLDAWLAHVRADDAPADGGAWAVNNCVVGAVAVGALLPVVRELARAIVEAEVVPGWSIWREGEEPSTCAFCGGVVEGDWHEPDCPVLRARALLDQP